MQTQQHEGASHKMWREFSSKFDLIVCFDCLMEEPCRKKCVTVQTPLDVTAVNRESIKQYLGFKSPLFPTLENLGSPPPTFTLLKANEPLSKTLSRAWQTFSAALSAFLVLHQPNCEAVNLISSRYKELAWWRCGSTIIHDLAFQLQYHGWRLRLLD